MHARTHGTMAVFVLSIVASAGWLAACETRKNVPAEGARQASPPAASQTVAQAVLPPADEFLVRWMNGKTDEAFDALLEAWGGESEPVWTRPWLTRPEEYYIRLRPEELSAIQAVSIEESTQLRTFLEVLQGRADVAIAGTDPVAPSRERVRAEARAVRRAGLALTDESRRSKFAVLNGRRMIGFAERVLQRLDAP